MKNKFLIPKNPRNSHGTPLTDKEIAEIRKRLNIKISKKKAHGYTLGL